jgi:CheY-like chemotaxis protein
MFKKRILLAEDDEDDQNFFSDCMKNRSDINLLAIADNGDEVVELLIGIDELPDLIILDQNMPKRNGLETLKLLKNDSRYSHIPVIIYSTYTDQKLIEDGSEMGACMVVSKPITREEYAEMINTLIEVCM